jgi:hypothetical protein
MIAFPDKPYQPSDKEVQKWKLAEPDSATIAIYTKFNELAERHGIEHRDFVALVRAGEDRQALEIEWRPSQSTDLTEQRFDRMLRSVGFPETSTILTGQDFEIIEALDKALQLAPKRPLRS